MKKALPLRVASIATTSLPKTRVRVLVASAAAGCVSALICSFRLTWRLAASWRAVASTTCTRAWTLTLNLMGGSGAAPMFGT